ncbi:hypothetical protein [Emticicia sp. TH156]|uniref:hypothetical protein n=1 Tax=Emticicia sp. TH156 TaxID=2067454 RepID=UPI00117DEFF8|nr:hypothetical protein [Emticicia sp. TH156]
MNKNLTLLKNFSLIISLIVYAMSLTQTAFTFKDYDGTKSYKGFELIIFGGMAILGGGLLEWFIWLANPIYIMGLFLFYKSINRSRRNLLAATIIAFSFMSWKEILASESGRTAPITSLNIGYYFWIISIVIATIGAFCYFYLTDKSVEK